MKTAYVLAVLSVSLSSAAQLCFKLGMTPAPSVGGIQKSISASPQLLEVLFTPWVLLGFVLYGASALIWLFVLARLDLSVAYPLVGLGFVATMAIGKYVLGEPVGATRMAGTLLICVGVILLAKSQ